MTCIRKPTNGVPCRAALAAPILAVVLAAAFAPAPAAGQTVALLPVVSDSRDLAGSVEVAVRDALLQAGYLIVSGQPVSTAMAQTGLSAVTSVEEGARLGRILGADVLLSIGVGPAWMSMTLMHLPSGSIETREGELPAERVDLPGTFVANLADAVSVMAGAGVQMPAVASPPVAPPPAEAPPEPAVETPPEVSPDVAAPAEPELPVQEEPREPPAFHADGPFRVRVAGALTVMLDEPARPGGGRTGGRVGAGFAYAIIPELDLGLDADVMFGQGTAIDVGLGAAYRWSLAGSIDLDLAPRVTFGYFQHLTGGWTPAFFARLTADLIWSIARGYAIYLSPACFTLVLGDPSSAVYEAAIGFLGSF